MHTPLIFPIKSYLKQKCDSCMEIWSLIIAVAGDHFSEFDNAIGLLVLKAKRMYLLH